MKALILAAGRGTRMNHLTDDMPKPLIKINKRAFLDLILENLSVAGIDDVGIVVGYKKEKIIQHLKDSEPKIKTRFIEQEEQLGTGHAIKMAKEWSGGEDFIVLMGDNLYSPKDIKNICREEGFCCVAGYEHKHPENFGVLVINKGRLERIVEKPSSPPSNMINTGLYRFTPDIFDALDRTKKSERDEYEITDAITMLCQKQMVKVVKIQDYWLNLGCPEDIPKLEKFLTP